MDRISLDQDTLVMVLVSLDRWPRIFAHLNEPLADELEEAELFDLETYQLTPKARAWLAEVV